MACLALSVDGGLIASASEKGTIIRVWKTVPSEGTRSRMEQELRRGSDRAEIYSIAFSPSNTWLAASSNKGTVHIWPLHLNNASVSADAGPPTQVLSSWTSYITKGLVPTYFSSKWSLAQYRLGDTSRSEIAFGSKENTVAIITCSGKLHKIQFDIMGGECKKVSFCKFV